MLPERRHPVPRLRVLGAALVVSAVIAGIVVMTETLRHPLPSGGPPVPELDVPAADPRIPVECADPEPREGQERTGPAGGQGRPRQVDSNFLYDCPEALDGVRVRYRGEVVGAILRRGEGAWVQLNDDVYAETLGPLPAHRDYRGGNAGVGVLIPHSLADQITVAGGPQTRGDVLQITGVFHRVDDASSEVTVIRADGGTVAEPGETFPDPPLSDRRTVAFVLLGVAVAVTVAERVAARRR